MSDAPVVLAVDDPEARATLMWKHHATDAAFTEVPMERSEGPFAQRCRLRLRW